LTVVGTGTQERDFIYVKDVVMANILAMENWQNKNLRSGNVYNVGSGLAIKIIDLAKAISQNIKFIPPRQGEAENNLCSVEKLQKEIRGHKTKNFLLKVGFFGSAATAAYLLILK
jgi:UDP-glucose 4-epimerase